MTRSLVLLIPAVALLAACATPAVTAFDDGVRLVFNRGNAYAAGGSLPAAIEDFSAATRLRPDYAQALFNRGTVRAAAGDVRGAVTDWQLAASMERDPWTRAAMQRGSGLDYVFASPGPRAGGVTAVMPPVPPSPHAITPEALDVRSLVARAVSREVDGDRAGAIADLRAAFAAEVDTDRRARIDRLLRTLEAAR